MIKKRMTYEDFNGESRTEDFWFHMSEVDLLEMDTKYPGGMQGFIQKMIDTKDSAEMFKLARDIIEMSYGEKSLDGRTFAKSPELTRNFTQTQAYVDLFMEIGSDADKAAEFVKGIMPAKVVAAALAHAGESGNEPVLASAT